MEVDIRFELEEGYTADDLIRDVGNGIDTVRAAVPLENDGFGRLMPDKTRAQVFVFPMTEQPTWHEHKGFGHRHGKEKLYDHGIEHKWDDRRKDA